MFNIFDNVVNYRGFFLYKIVLVNIIIGYVILIGEFIKKCLGFFVMSKCCRICINVKKKGVFLRKYVCLCNWIVFVKFMELVMVCEMF